ncbi:hypothetical protein B0T16DRAFT_43627 [Cercophora newfieldiana]|uniref:Uncharacterized protein n=1 Tax=Cercophora newfieldiana TaxID=92897 RepID=A0AA39YQ98_9PEZI|nr:hypothetical protein B0T16DRAFT_43627 [Cercophora newfieldiana]
MLLDLQALTGCFPLGTNAAFLCVSALLKFGYIFVHAHAYPWGSRRRRVGGSANVPPVISISTVVILCRFPRGDRHPPGPDIHLLGPSPVRARWMDGWTAHGGWSRQLLVAEGWDVEAESRTPPPPGDLRSPCIRSLPSMHLSAGCVERSTRFWRGYGSGQPFWPIPGQGDKRADGLGFVASGAEACQKSKDLVQPTCQGSPPSHLNSTRTSRRPLEIGEHVVEWANDGRDSWSSPVCSPPSYINCMQLYSFTWGATYGARYAVVGVTRGPCPFCFHIA